MNNNNQKGFTTVLPENPPNNFNEWAIYINQLLNQIRR